MTNANQPPVFSTDITNQSSAEGDTVSLDADATDADLDTLTYSATNLPAGISIAPSTGVLSGTLTIASAGTYNVVITVSDGTDIDTDPFTWTVTNTNQRTGLQHRVHGSHRRRRCRHQPRCQCERRRSRHADLLGHGAALRHHHQARPRASSQGTLSATSSGSYNTVITVSDGTLTDTDSFTWTVTNTNQPPVFSTEFTDRTDAEGAVISLDANASDPDAGTTLVYSATGLPSGITINSSTGVFSGTLSSTSSGSYNTVITVSDGTLTDTDSFTWTVTNTNQPPVFSTEFTDRTDAEGAVISLDANASDPDAGTTLVYSRHRSALRHHHQLEHGCLQRHAQRRPAAGSLQRQS